MGNDQVQLIAVTKNVGLKTIEEAFRLGVTEFGENRVQDAIEKQEQLAVTVAERVNWHLIGHLQTNKVKQVVGRFKLIHSIDSMRLAEAVSKEAGKRGLVQPVLLQVKVVEDPSKFGFTCDELREEFPRIVGLPGISVQGLMTITPLAGDRETWLTCFDGLRSLRDELAERHQTPLPELSMGMTQDWREAVACGATMVRLGRAVFGS